MVKKMSLENINSISDVELFALQLKEELGLGFHPDDPFEDYINLETREQTYTLDESAIRNELIDQAFEICENNNVDIYETMGRVIVKGTPLNGMFD